MNTSRSLRWVFHSVVTLVVAVVVVDAGDVSFLAADQSFDSGDEQEYTAFSDRSWAITGRNMSDVMPHQKSTYEQFIEECVGEDSWCDDSDRRRMKMNAEQPGGVVNYTKQGFKKIRAPEPLFKLLKNFWEANKHHAVVEMDHASCFHNSWKIPTTILKTEDNTLEGGGWNLSAAVWNSARDILEEWTGQKLAGSSVYGIRVYHNQSILTPHCDRLPLVSSAIINVDQDVDEDWVLEVYGHDGKATNVTMKPGDMVLYESHSVIHGRPYPLNGRFYANIFVHFETMGDIDSMECLPPEGGLPPYVQEHFSDKYFSDFPEGWTLLTDIVGMVQRGDLYTLRYVAQRDSDFVKEPSSRCSIMLMAAESQHIDVLEFLINDMEYDINMVCHFRTPLDIAVEELGWDDPVIDYFIESGAKIYHDVQPDNVTTDDRCEVMNAAVWYPSATRHTFAFLIGSLGYDVNMVCDNQTALDLLLESFGEESRISGYLKARGGLTHDELVVEHGELEESTLRDKRCDVIKAAVIFGQTDAFDLLIDELNYDINTACNATTALDLAYQLWGLDDDLVTYLEEEDGTTLQDHSDTFRKKRQADLDGRCSTMERAIANGDLHVVEFLLTEMDYPVNMVCGDESTPLDIAEDNNWDEDHPLVVYLLEQGGQYYEESLQNDEDIQEEKTAGDSSADEL